MFFGARLLFDLAPFYLMVAKGERNMKKVISVVLAVTVICASLVFSPISVHAGSVIETAIAWAVTIANDDTHGYSWDGRWGPDYDCSSLVISAFRESGLSLSEATTTKNMKSVFTKEGFTWIPASQIDLSNTNSLIRGDILLNESSHTEIYLGNRQNVGAHRGYMSQWCSHSNKDGEYHRHGHYSLGEQKGDQDGGEISVAGYYNYPWDGVLRYNVEPPYVDLGDKFVANIIKANDWSTIVNNNTNVEIHYGYGYANEYWLFNKCDDGSYTVKSLEDGKYLDVEEAGNRDGLNIHVYDYTGANNQKWFIKQSSYGKILVPQCALNSCLDVNNDGSANGTNVQLWSQNDSSAQGLNIYIQPEIPCFINLGNEFTANLIKANDWSTIVNKGTNVEIQYGYGNANEYWWFKREKDGSYIIKSLEDGKYLDVSEAGSSDGLNIHVFDYTGAKNQKWYITDGPFGKVLVPQCAVNSCLDVNNDGTANGTNVQLWTQNMSSAQGLNIYKQPDVPNFDNLGEIFTCKMRTVIDNRCIINNNTNAEIGESKNNINEYWIFERKNDGTYTIKSLSNGKYLDVDKNGNSDGLNIYTYEYTGANNQRWYIRKAGITYNLIPKCAPHSALDINENEYEVGTNIQLWSQNQSDAQRFSIYFATPNYLLGDADGDGVITIMDATVIQRYVASYTVKNPKTVELCGDVTGDGLDIVDATCIQRYLADFTVPYSIGEPIT